MKNNLKFIYLFLGIILTVVVNYLLFNSANTNKVIISSENSSKENISSSNALTMMYETEYQSGEYVVSTDSTWSLERYTFNETLSKCENGSKLTWDDENNKVLMQANKSDRCYVYFDAFPNFMLAEYITTQVYTADGENELYYHDGQGTYINSDQEAGDNSYRYSGANPNNYVCFGSDEATCPEDNLYRIIGVFDGHVKLIKLTSIGDYSWDADNVDFSSVISTNNQDNNYNVIQLNGILAAPDPGSIGSNDWENADLNYYINNDYFLNTLNSIWQNMISLNFWQIGGIESNDVYNGSMINVYDGEIGINSVNITYQSKIGLMYVSDYGYAASPENWLTSMSSYDIARDNNWLFSGLEEWTISPYTYPGSVYIITNGGLISGYNSNVVDDPYAVRPTFYLSSDVLYASGDGTKDSPIRIVV